MTEEDVGVDAVLPAEEIALLASGPPTMLRERLDRLGAATDGLLESISHTQALLDVAARIVEPGFQKANRSSGSPVSGGSPVATRRVAREGAVLGLTEVSLRTGRHPDLLRRWSETGRIPAMRVGRSWAIPESALADIAWPAARRRRLRGPALPSGPGPEDEQADERAVDVEG